MSAGRSLKESVAVARAAQALGGYRTEGKNRRLAPRAKSFTIVEVQPVLIVKSKLIKRLFQFQGSSSSIAVDHPVDEWSLAQIRNGNNDQRFLEATRPQRKAMMAKGMWPLVTPDPVVLPCHSDHDDVDYEERRIRHRSGDESNDDVHMYVVCT